MGTGGGGGGSFRVRVGAGEWSWSHLHIVPVKNEWSRTSIAPICVHDMHKENFEVTFHHVCSCWSYSGVTTTVVYDKCASKCTSNKDTLHLTLNIPSLGRQRCLPSWGPGRTPWFFGGNFSTVWCGRLLKLCFLGFWDYNSVIQALLVSNILCLFISTEVSQ